MQFVGSFSAVSCISHLTSGNIAPLLPSSTEGDEEYLQERNFLTPQCCFAVAVISSCEVALEHTPFYL